MKTPRDPDALLAAYLAAGMEVMPDRVVDAVLDDVHRTRQRAVFGPWRTRSMSKTTIGVAAAVAVLVLGSAVWLGAFRPSGNVGGPSLSPSPLAIASASPPASPSLSPSPLAIASASPPASPTLPPPFRLQFDDNGATVTVDIDDQSGLLVEATKGEIFYVDNPPPGGEGICRWEGTVVGPCGKEVILLNAPSDDSVLRVEWFAGGGCAGSNWITIDPTARKLRIEVPVGAYSDTIGGTCDVTLRFSKPVPAEEVEGRFGRP